MNSIEDEKIIVDERSVDDKNYIFECITLGKSVYPDESIGQLESPDSSMKKS